MSEPQQKPKRKYIPPHLRNKKVTPQTNDSPAIISRKPYHTTRGYGSYNDKSYTRSGPKPQDTNTQRKHWKLGSKLEIYSVSKKKWEMGEVIKIYQDTEGEWLVIRYSQYQQKDIQRFNSHIRPMQTQTYNNRNVETVGSKRFCRDTPTPKHSQDARVNRMVHSEKIIGPLPDGRGHATVVFVVNSKHIRSQRKLLRTALEFVNLNPLPSPEKVKRTYGDCATSAGCTVHIEYASRISYHSIFSDVVKKQSNNPTQIQLLTEIFKGDHLNEVQYFLAFTHSRDKKLLELTQSMDILPQYNDDLEPIQALIQYMSQHQIIFDEELDCIRVNVRNVVPTSDAITTHDTPFKPEVTYTPTCDDDHKVSTSNEEASIDVEGVMKAFDIIHAFVKFVQSHFELNQRNVLSFMVSSKSSQTEMMQLLQDTDCTAWKGITGYMVSYHPNQQCVSLLSRTLPLILRLLLVKNVHSYLSKRFDVEEAKKQQLKQFMERSIGHARFHYLLSIIDAKASPLPSPPIHKAVSVRYIRYSENVVQFIYNDGSFMEYNFSRTHPKDIRFIEIGLAHDEYLIGVLISNRHCLFMTNHHIMNGSAGFRSGEYRNAFSNANLFQIERKQHIIGLEISQTHHNTLYDAVINVIPSEFRVDELTEVMEPCTDEGKCVEEEQEGDDMKQFEQIGEDEWVKFPAIFRFINWSNLLMPLKEASWRNINGDQESMDTITHLMEKATITGTDEGQIMKTTQDAHADSNDKVLDQINKHRFFFIACHHQRSFEPKIHVFSFPSTFYRISKDFNTIEAQFDIEVRTKETDKSWLVPQ